MPRTRPAVDGDEREEEGGMVTGMVAATITARRALTCGLINVAQSLYSAPALPH